MKKASIAAAVAIACIAIVLLLPREEQPAPASAPEPPPLARSKAAVPVAVDDDLGIGRDMGPLEAPPTPPPPADAPAMVVGVASPTSLHVRDGARQQTVQLASLRSPGDCGNAPFDGEALRFLADLIENEEVILHKNASDAYVVRRARDNRDVNLAMLRNGYACADQGKLPDACPLTYVAHEQSARTHQRGMWRVGSALAKGYVPESRNAAAVLRR